MAGAAGGVGAMAGLTSEELADFVRASCERQGVPVKVTDSLVVSRVSALLTGEAPSTEVSVGVGVGQEVEAPRG